MYPLRNIYSSIALFIHPLLKRYPSIRYSPDTHPVLAFKGAPASFPVKPYHRHLQRYLQWSDTINTLANEYINEVMGGAKFIGVHMRIGSDWVHYNISYYNM